MSWRRLVGLAWREGGNERALSTDFSTRTFHSYRTSTQDGFNNAEADILELLVVRSHYSVVWKRQSH